MNKTTKWVLKIGAISLSAIPVATLVSCGGGGAKNEYKNSKIIIVSVDGSQKRMWKEVEQQFQKSDAYKKGFRIKEVEKDTFGTISAIEAIGYADENVPDIVYMPQDKLTSLLQQKALRPFKDSEINSLFDIVGATPPEKEASKKYIDQVFHGKKASFAFPHNREGLAVATVQDPGTATTYLKQKGIVGAMNEAKLLANLQNLWYGSALFAKPIGTDGEIATDYILYGDGADWSSGFMIDNKYHLHFKKILDTMSDMWFEPLAKAYKAETKADDDIIGSDWVNSKITSGELKNFFQSDEGAVTNMMSSAVQSGDLDYFYTGTWNAQVWAAKGIKTYVNAPLYTHGNTKKSENDFKFQQATGTWSFGINARNNGVNKDRIDAIMEVLKAVYSSSAFTNYFLDDSKVPYFDSLQKKVEVEAGKSNAPKRKDALDLYNNRDFQANLNTKGGTSNQIDVTKNTEPDKIRELARWFSKYNLGYNNLKKWSVSNEWKSGVELTKDVYKNPTNKDVGDLNYELTPYNNSNPLFEDTLGIVDATAKLLGFNTINDLDKGGSFSYKVGVNKLKNGISSLPEFNGIKEENGAQVHIRKLSKYWSSFNADNKTETSKFIEKFKVGLDNIDNLTKLNSAISLAKDKFDNVVKDQIKKAKEFVSRYSKNTAPNDQTISKIVTQYLNNFWNKTKREALFEFTKSNLLSKINFSISSTQNKKYADIKKIIEEAAKSLSLSEIFNVLTANGNDRGTFSSQEGRFDRSNPQFSTIWELWNQNAFGNKVFLQKAIINAVSAGLKVSGSTRKHDVAENKFKEIVQEKLADLFGKKVSQLESANASGHVVIE